MKKNFYTFVPFSASIYKSPYQLKKVELSIYIDTFSLKHSSLKTDIIYNVTDFKYKKDILLKNIRDLYCMNENTYKFLLSLRKNKRTFDNTLKLYEIDISPFK